MDKNKVEMVTVVVEVDNLTHEGKPVEKGHELTVTVGQAKVMTDMKLVSGKGNSNGGK